MAQLRRRTLLINKRFQWRLAFYVCSWVVALSFIYPLIINNIFEYFLRYAEMDPTGTNAAVLLQTRNDILVLLIMLQATFMLLTLLVSLFLAHRIAGPLHKLKTLFEKVKAGDLSDDLHLRKFDHFKDLAESYNSMMGVVRQRLATTASHIEEAKSHSSPDGKKELDSALKVLSGIPFDLKSE